MTKTLDFATISDLNNLNDIGGNYYLQQSWQSGVVDVAEKTAKELEEKLGFPERLSLVTYKTYNRDVYLPYNSYFPKSSVKSGLPEVLVYVLTDSERGGETKLKALPGISVENIEVLNSLTPRTSLYYLNTPHKGDLLVTVKLGESTFPILMPFRSAEQLFSIRLTDNLDFICQGKVYSFPDLTTILENSAYPATSPNDFVYDSVRQVFTFFSSSENADKYLKSIVTKIGTFNAQVTNGITKIYNRVAPFALEAASSTPTLFAAFRTFAANSKLSIDRVKISTIFNATYADVTDVETFKAATSPLGDALIENIGSYKGFYNSFRMLPSFTGKRKAALRASATGAFNKLMEDFDFIKDTLDQTKFPKIYNAIHDGEIPISTFFRKKEQYFLLNDNWKLWEKMLTHHKETTLELAREVSKRSTYEKDLMSYFYFILHELPDYLKKHTGVKWTCSPRLIDSPSELDPPESEDGVTKKRSALTPDVNNEKHTVIVPYASLGMPGRQTVYCYSHNYSVIKRGFTLNGNTAMSDLEEGLNGRDDYGLMFYTLTGSHNGRGYPTFLIIFERRTAGTHVHFHRTHPCRSKDGDYNPVHNWIRTSYNWMVGNVHKSRIKVQQGDLVFVTADDGYRNTVDVIDTLVQKYDNHCFDAPVKFLANNAKVKSNLLGHFLIEKDRILNHPEHNAVTVPAGFYELRQCRSWEANPAGIWSLRID